MQHYDYSQAGAYFLTLCARRRRCILGEVDGDTVRLSHAGSTVTHWWRSLPDRFRQVELDQFVVMPNHVHGIVLIHEEAASVMKPLITGTGALAIDAVVGAVHEPPLQPRRRMLLPLLVGYFKMNSAKVINRLLGTSGLPVWQRDYYEHIVRNERELLAMQQYIVDNPRQWSMDEENLDHPRFLPDRSR